jgi:hypothetical protein
MRALHEDERLQQERRESERNTREEDERRTVVRERAAEEGRQRQAAQARRKALEARRQVAVPKPAEPATLRSLLSDRKSLHQLIVLREILGPPVALRDPGHGVAP